jgi:hypothetical protein
MSLPLTLRNINRQFVELPEPVTIDSGADEGRFLRAMRKHFPNAKQHATVSQAFGNVVGETEATLIGHGVEAFLGAGVGSALGHTDGQHLCFPHKADWEQVVDGLGGRNIKRLTIFACSVGAGANGAALVFALAKKLQAKVRAPIGDVWADEVTRRPCMTADGGWVEATPQMSSPPAPTVLAPVPWTNDTLRRPNSGNVVLFEGDRFLPVPFASVRSINCPATSPDAKPGQLSCSGDGAQAWSSAFAFNAPLIFGGALASFVTGKLTLTFTLLGREETREFLVHNDRFIEDVRFPGVFYRVDMSVLRNLLS